MDHILLSNPHSSKEMFKATRFRFNTPIVKQLHAKRRLSAQKQGTSLATDYYDFLIHRRLTGTQAKLNIQKRVTTASGNLTQYMENRFTRNRPSILLGSTCSKCFRMCTQFIKPPTLKFRNKMLSKLLNSMHMNKSELNTQPSPTHSLNSTAKRIIVFNRVKQLC